MTLQVSDMNDLSPTRVDAAILAWLKESGVQVTAGVNRRWELTLNDCFTTTGTGHCEPHWLILDFPLRPRSVAAASIDPWRLLRLNQDAGAFVKVVMPRMPDSSIHVRGEMPLDCCAGEDLARRIGLLCAELRDLARVVAEGTTKSAPEQAVGESEIPALLTLGAESGWPFDERRGGARLSTRLESERAPYHAIVERLPGGEIQTWVDLVSWAADDAEGAAGPAPACRTAVGVLLMTASSRVRLARGAIIGTETEPTVQLQARLPRDAGPSDLSHTFSALSVACELFAPEAQLLLTNPGIAEAFLARGWSPAIPVDAGGACPLGNVSGVT